MDRLEVGLLEVWFVLVESLESSPLGRRRSGSARSSRKRCRRFRRR